jgi:hypothetical protein
MLRNVLVGFLVDDHEFGLFADQMPDVAQRDVAASTVNAGWDIFDDAWSLLDSDMDCSTV